MIVGGAGYNQIDGGEGDDEIHVEQGRDTIVVCRNSGNDTIFGFDQGDTVYITSSARTKLKVSDIQYEKDLDYVPVGTDGDYELKAIYGNAVKIEFGCGNNSLTLIGLQSQDLCIGSNTIRVHA